MNTQRPTSATDSPGRYTRGFGVSLGITAIANGVLVILKESNEESLLAWMKALTGHHWITHGLLMLLLYVLLGLLLARSRFCRRLDEKTLQGILILGVLVGAGLIFGFYFGLG